MESSNWFDQIVTPLNACSIETYEPLPYNEWVEPIAKNDCNSDVTTSQCDYVIPLIIGCYQLNELSVDGSAPGAEEDTSQSASKKGADPNDGVGVPVESNSRSGELRLYMISSTKSSTSSITESANDTRVNDEAVRFRDASCIVKMESGVLDGKWRKRVRAHEMPVDSVSYGSKPLFASACASGKIHLHSLEKNRSTKEWSLSHLASSGDQSNIDGASLCLSLAWNDFIDMDCDDDTPNNEPDQILSSFSNGTVALHRVVAESRELSDEACGCEGDNNWNSSICVEETHRWNAHHMFGCPSEVWACSFLRGNANVVLSGADDCSLKIWDIRQTLRPMHKIGNSEFTAGVTAISPHPACSHVFAVGSYDEIVRIYDHRKIDEPMAKFHVGGGVWRIKWHPKCRGKILVAAMHAGCRVVNVRALDSSYTDRNDPHAGVEILSEFSAHESMAYGADWLCFGQPCCEEVAASCSFYDRKAFLWDPYNQPKQQSVHET